MLDVRVPPPHPHLERLLPHIATITGDLLMYRVLVLRSTLFVSHLHS
jgi:hypothetical protein